MSLRPALDDLLCSQVENMPKAFPFSWYLLAVEYNLGMTTVAHSDQTAAVQRVLWGLLRVWLAVSICQCTHVHEVQHATADDKIDAAL